MTNDSEGGGSRERDTRPAQLIITIFGLCARDEGNWLSVAAVVALMSDLNVDGQAVRSAVSRLKRRGVLCSERYAGAAGYSLSSSTLEVLSEGDVRIFKRTRATEEDGWLIAVFSVPESEREKRYALRATLTRLGFGTAAPGVWIAPGTAASETRHTLGRLQLSTYVDLFSADYLAFEDVRAKIGLWWDLEELTALYSQFLKSYRPILYAMTTNEPLPAEAFAIYTPMLTQWRRLPYRDPGIPLTLLPPAWNGEAAGALFDALNEQLRPLAEKHALAVIHGR